ncbi:hypothetical protein PsAD13_04479 [Pseudovibrio sp. Ad13]|uniref:hypothetical protein n=1 Tax=unclassified Pseudovibrio TaxID=2627060 RepID=UPI0007AEC9B1|nr:MULTISPECIES: hypothetical protein [unclassified Pseudovibrio]KZK80419.1 hypothetical protein PsAD13_04479 [Pseudovibrio sp. Ad13]KZL21660.1 hypothetical protein PsWM33_04232 [Pseudovibrio sp. WM33]
MKSYFVAGVAASSILLAGCGTVVRGTTEDIKIDVKPANAKITSTTAHTCVGPCVINVPRSQKLTLKASAPGYQSQVIDVDTRVSGKGAAGMVGNVLIGGIIGIGVDTVTGASLDHYPNPVTFNLKRGTGTRKLTPVEMKLMNKAKALES